MTDLALSRLSLDNHLTTQQSVANSLTTDLNSALSLCFYQTENVPDLLNVILWLGRLPSYRSSLAAVTATSTALTSAISDVLLPYMRDKEWVIKQYLFSSLTQGRYQTFQIVLALAKIWNYLMFLQKGDYRRLCDRVLDIKYLSTPPKTQPVTDSLSSSSSPSSFSPSSSSSSLPDLPDYYFLFEKHLIRSLTQLLHTSLPLVWKSRLYKKVVRMRRAQKSGLCGECHERAVNVVWTGCGHLHCHFCLGERCGVCDTLVDTDTLCYP